jgi:hypothetical protein
MKDLWIAIGPDMLELLAGIVVSLLGIVIARVGTALRQKFASESERALVSTIEKVADIVVRDLEQTLVPAVKSGLADGKLTRQEAERIREIGIDLVVSRLNSKVGRELAGHAVEAAVQAMKERRSAPPAAR